MVSLWNVHIDLKHSIRTTGDGNIEAHIPIFVRDRGPVHVDQLVLEIIDMDSYIAEGRFAVVDQSIPIRVEPGSGRTMPRAIGYAIPLLECNEVRRKTRRQL